MHLLTIKCCHNYNTINKFVLIIPAVFSETKQNIFPLERESMTDSGFHKVTELPGPYRKHMQCQ